MEYSANGVRIWGRDIEEATVRQAEMTNRLPILGGPVALMPDAHVGLGSTVGSVIATDGAVIPAAVGVDIGCGMAAVRLDGLDASRLPDDINTLMPLIHKSVPAGVGQAGLAHTDIEKAIGLPELESLTPKELSKAESQVGSLGSGNHFFEMGIDEADRVWIVLHSGSRGVGNLIAQRHIKTAKKWYFENIGDHLESNDLAYFLESSVEFQTYISSMLWAQDYAELNREVMLKNALKEIFRWFSEHGLNVRGDDWINCHHNFTALERHCITCSRNDNHDTSCGGNDTTHDISNLWITRKGAIKAAVGDRGIIPGSMGTSTYIVRGLGNPLSYDSCSHGAGRLMSRKRAKEEFTPESLSKLMEGKVWNDSSAQALVDEHPNAYKDIHRVMEDQADLVEVEHVLNQVLNYKGA